jgi:XTP/dITP diphosphohydrolase
VTVVPHRVVVASKNPDKIREVEAVLARMEHPWEIVRGLEWPDVDETEPTLEGNAVLKAEAVAEATGLPALADDTGLEVDALDGAPGVHSARFAGPTASYEANVDRLLRDMAGVEDRTARFRTAIALVVPGSEILIVDGVIDGTITTERRGDRGFGYDPVFAVGDRTYGEMSDGEKNEISHRARALRALGAALDHTEDEA